MDKILIKDLTARGIIGVNDWERQNPQEIRINITLFADTRRAAEHDDIAYGVNYRTVAKKALAHAESAQRLTVEALAADIARRCRTRGSRAFFLGRTDSARSHHQDQEQHYR